MKTLFAATWWFGRIAVEAAHRRWQESSESDSALRLLDAVVEGAAAVERDPQVLSVGYGGLPNRDGEVELDAAVMEGARLRAGAVAGVRGFMPVVYLARAVMERTPHLMLVGDGAARFALRQGYEPQQLLTAESLRRWQEWRQRQTAPKEVSQERADSHDTVGVLGWNEGHLGGRLHHQWAWHGSCQGAWATRRLWARGCTPTTRRARRSARALARRSGASR
jgi:N4-(beta-N-acetylglucosaminyl)-L-asparaginase